MVTVAKCKGDLILIDGLPVQSKQKLPYNAKDELHTYMYHKKRGMVQITQKNSQPIPVKQCKMWDVAK